MRSVLDAAVVEGEAAVSRNESLVERMESISMLVIRRIGAGVGEQVQGSQRSAQFA